MKRPFSELSQAEKRVAIAQDVIASINQKIYVAIKGGYVTNIKLKRGVPYVGGNVQKHFDEIESCMVCALGACLMSITKYENKLLFGDLGGGINALNANKVTSLFASLFSPSQLFMIETAFEGMLGDRIAIRLFNYFPCTDSSKEMYHASIDFYTRMCSNSDEKRMIAIMKNIIRNKGEFKP